MEEGTPIPTPWNKEAFDNFGYRIQVERDSIREANLPVIRCSRRLSLA